MRANNSANKGVVIIKEIIMAGGKGTRLRPLTCSLPKPMVPILNKPVMEYTINLLKKHGINDIAVTVAYLPKILIDYFGTGEKWGVNLSFYIEEGLLGTGGSVRNAEEFIEETFVVISGDALTDLDIKKAIKYHESKTSKVTIVLKKEDAPMEYGVVITDEEGKITRFLEKPSWGEVFSNTINRGIYIMEPEVLYDYRKGENFNFRKDLFPRLLSEKINMYGFVTGDYWCDIGDLKSYKQTHFDILDGKVNIELENLESSAGIWMGKDTIFEGNVEIEPPVYIGQNCLINRDAVLGAYTIIGDNCNLEARSVLKKSIIWDNIFIGSESHVSGAVVCSNATVKKRVNVYENVVIGEGSVLGDNVIIKPSLKLWPLKIIDEDSVVNQNLVWGTKLSKMIFGNNGISGDVNVEITPEFASKLGATFASISGGESIIVVGNDGSNAGALIGNSLIAGIHTTGAQAISIDNVVSSLNQYAVRYHKANGGFFVNKDNVNSNNLHIEIVNENGVNVDRNLEREIENLMIREDFVRCNADQIKNVINSNNIDYYYIEEGIKLLKNVQVIKKTNPKVIIASKSKNNVSLAEKFLKRIGCQIRHINILNKFEEEDNDITSVANKVIETEANLGVVIKENSGSMILIDESGRIIESERLQSLLALTIFKLKRIKKLILPYTFPNVIENMAKFYGVEIIKTKSNPANVMNEMIKNIDSEDNAPYQYILNYQAIWAVGILIDFLMVNEVKLGDLLDEIPDFNYTKRAVQCDWKDKGRVMKKMIEENKNNKIELYEGVKIIGEKGWAIILADSEKAMFNIHMEGLTQEYAEELSVFYEDKIRKIIENQNS